MLGTFVFDERQPRALNGGRRVLLLLNERRVAADDITAADGQGGNVQEAPSGWAYDGVWLETDGRTTEAALLAAARKQALEDIAAYDKSGRVNGFFVNGRLHWLDKDTRVGLVNSTTIAKATGREKVTLWLDGEGVELTCAQALAWLERIEMYALACFGVTAGHRKAVEGLATVDEVVAYDFRAGYPERLSFSI